MGVDYDGVGGIGIEFTSKMSEKFITKGLFTEEEWDDDINECMERIGIPFNEAGSANYGGDGTMYLIVDGETLEDVLLNEGAFREKLSKVGINIGREDLQVISDILIW